jgi:hypothetical protein
MLTLIGPWESRSLKEIERRVKRPLGTVKTLLVSLSKGAPTYTDHIGETVYGQLSAAKICCFITHFVQFAYG